MGDFITLLPGWLPSSGFQGQRQRGKAGFGEWCEKHDNAAVRRRNNSRVWEGWWSVALAMKSGDCPSDISRLSQMWAFCSGGRISYLGKTGSDPVGFACLAGFLHFLESPLPAFAWFRHSSIHDVLKSPFLHRRHSSFRNEYLVFSTPFYLCWKYLMVGSCHHQIFSTDVQIMRLKNPILSGDVK